MDRRKDAMNADLEEEEEEKGNGRRSKGDEGDEGSAGTTFRWRRRITQRRQPGDV